jgi:hypothetical protein
MTDTTAAVPLRHYPQKHERPDIPLPNGDMAVPRERFGKNTLGVSDDTVRKMNLPTLYVAAVAYIIQNAALDELASRAKRRNEKKAKKRSK